MLQKVHKECYEGTVATDIPDEIKAECGDLEVIYVKTVDCPAGIVTRFVFHNSIFIYRVEKMLSLDVLVHKNHTLHFNPSFSNSFNIELILFAC